MAANSKSGKKGNVMMFELEGDVKDRKHNAWRKEGNEWPQNIGERTTGRAGTAGTMVKRIKSLRVKRRKSQ